MNFSELLLKCSLPQSSKIGSKTSRVKTFLKDKLPKYAPNLNSYISACQDDPELKSFDSSLRHQTSKLLSALQARGKNEYLSIDVLMGVSGFLLEQSQVVITTIVESKEDVCQNEELRSLVDRYFESTTKTLNLFKTVENCVNKAKISQLIIRTAVKQFETEDLEGNNNKKKYAKTLEELNKFKAKGDPFGDEFLRQYESVLEQQDQLLKELREMNEKIEKKHKNLKKLKKWRVLSNVIFGATLVSALVLSVVLTGMIPPLGIVATIAVAGIWVNEMWKECEKTVKTEKYLHLLTENNTKFNIREMENIKVLVDKLVVKISLILEIAELALKKDEEEEATKAAMREIMMEVEGFSERINEVGENAAKCSSLIVSKRMLVSEHCSNFHQKYSK